MDALRAALPLLIFALAFILLIVLPARARNRAQQQARQMQEALTVGTDVMMTCGLYGRVAGLHDDTLDLEIAPGVVTRFARAAVSTVGTDATSSSGSASSGSSHDGSDSVDSTTTESGRNENPPEKGYTKE